MLFVDWFVNLLSILPLILIGFGIVYIINKLSSVNSIPKGSIPKGGWKCEYCGQIHPSYDSFCSCGASRYEEVPKPKETVKQTNTNGDPFIEIRRYKELLDDGIITQEEYESKKKQILNL